MDSLKDFYDFYRPPQRKYDLQMIYKTNQKCIEINHYVSGCDSPFNYLQIADVQESLREIENALNIKAKE